MGYPLSPGFFQKTVDHCHVGILQGPDILAVKVVKEKSYITTVGLHRVNGKTFLCNKETLELFEDCLETVR